MIFFKINKGDIRRLRRSISQREQHVLKLEIKDRLEREDYRCVFKPERKVQKEEGMQYKLEIQDNKGIVLKKVEIENGTMSGLNEWVHFLLEKYPTGIYLKVEVAWPDPEVVEIKKQITEKLHQAFQHGQGFDDATEMLFNAFDIKLKGNTNA